MEIECNLFMKLLNGFNTAAGNNKFHVLKLKHNLYEKYQVGKIWYNHLIVGLERICLKV